MEKSKSDVAESNDADDSSLADAAEEEAEDEDDEEEFETPAMKALKQLSAVPKKSILKKSNSYTIHAGQAGA